MQIDNIYHKNLQKLIPKGLQIDTKQVSTLLGIKHKRLSRLLNGTAKKVLISELQKIADFFKIDLATLFK